LGGFRLAPGNLRGDGGLACLFLLPSLALGGRFALWLIGMGIRQMHRQIQNLEATMRATNRHWRALARSSGVVRDIGAPPDTRRARHDRPKRRHVDHALPAALRARGVDAPAAARALGWMIRFHNHQPLLVVTPSVHRDGLDVFRVVRSQDADDGQQLQSGHATRSAGGVRRQRGNSIYRLLRDNYSTTKLSLQFVRTTSRFGGAFRFKA
jgi:hypothetical protein